MDMSRAMRQGHDQGTDRGRNHIACPGRKSKGKCLRSPPSLAEKLTPKIFAIRAGDGTRLKRVISRQYRQYDLMTPAQGFRRTASMLATILCFTCAPAAAQNSNRPPPEVHASRAARPPVIDGRLVDEAWTAA